MRNQLVEVASVKKPGRPSTIKDPLDVYVGRRLRRRRLALGISQSSLGVSVGVSFQQVQKYESGANRAVVRRLYDFARTLNVSPGYFFEGYGESMRCAMPFAESQKPEAPALPHSAEETLVLVRAYRNVESAPLRQEILRMILGLEGM